MTLFISESHVGLWVTRKAALALECPTDGVWQAPVMWRCLQLRQAGTEPCSQYCAANAGREQRHLFGIQSGCEGQRRQKAGERLKGPLAVEDGAHLGPMCLKGVRYGLMCITLVWSSQNEPDGKERLLLAHSL